jgi:hypothetical protein
VILTIVNVMAKKRAKRGIKFGRFDPPPPGDTDTTEVLRV